MLLPDDDAGGDLVAEGYRALRRCPVCTVGRPRNPAVGTVRAIESLEGEAGARETVSLSDQREGLERVRSRKLILKAGGCNEL